MVPGTITGEDSASVFFDMMPLDTHLAGSAHSHPNGVLRRPMRMCISSPGPGGSTLSSATRTAR